MRRTAVLACALGLTLAAAPSALADPSGMVADPSAGPLTMHGDRIPLGSDFELRGRIRTAPRLAATALPAAWCGTERSTDDTANASHGGGARVKVVYAYAQGEPNRFAAYRDLIQADIGTVASWVGAASGERRTIRFDTGTSCGPDYVDVASIQLPRARTTYTGSASRASMVVADVKSALSGMTGTRNLLVYADGLYANDYILGSGQMPQDDSPDAGNYANSGGAVAMVWGDGERDFVPERLTTVLHEVSHTLGAVQDSAPNSTLAGHCHDVSDVMCYADGGPAGQVADLEDVCAPSSPLLPYECGMDDYFNPAPAAGSYLDTHWNLYDSRFMCDLASCVVPAGATPAPAPPPATPAPADPTTPAPAPDPGAQPPADPVPDPGAVVGEDASAWLDGFVAGGTAALRRVGLRGLAQGRAASLRGAAPSGYSVQVDLMVGASAIAGGTLSAGGNARLKIPRVHRLILARRTKVRFTLQGVIRAAAGGGPPTVKRVSITLKAPPKKKRRSRR